MVPFRPNLRATAEREPMLSRLAIRMFRPPHSARVTCLGDQPRALFWQGARCVITSAAGPWHASGSWWNGEAWDHDLWDVVIAEPVQALRLRQDHSSQVWSVVGLYD